MYEKPRLWERLLTIALIIWLARVIAMLLLYVVSFFTNQPPSEPVIIL
jgi:hypothetical protein